MRRRRYSRTLLVCALLSIAERGAAQQIVSGILLASLKTGSLAGLTFPISFSYDASGASSQGQVYLPLTAFNFSLSGTAFTRAGIHQGGQVILRDGKFENVTASFQGSPPSNPPLLNITFGFGGDGVIGYIDLAGNYGSGAFDLSTVEAAANAASFLRAMPLSPGSLVTIFGAGLAAVTETGVMPLPSTLGGVSGTVGGASARLLYVSPSQINLQIPWEATTGAADMVVTTNGGALDALRVTIATASPGVFSLGWGVGQAIAINPDGSLAAPDGSIAGIKTHPAHAGDYLMIFATGLGAVTPAIADGAPAGNIIRTAVATPAVLVGGVPARVTFAGLASEFAGVNQINIVVPPVGGDAVSLQIETAGIRTSEKVVVAVRNP
jgi:uncharacterized protein (TIGR03437 family)